MDPAADVRVHRHRYCVSAGGTAFSALLVDLTNERERTRLLSVVWALRLVGVLLGTVLVNRVFGSACETGAGPTEIVEGLQRLMWLTPLILFGLGLVAVVGVERCGEHVVPSREASGQQRVSLGITLRVLRRIPQAMSFLVVMCLFTFSMFLNDAVLEPYGAAVFGMNICATTSLNALLAIGFLLGLLFSGFQVVPRLGMVRASQLGAVMASLALLSMLLAAPDQAQALLRISVAGFGVSLGLCIHACFNLMFNFVEPGLTHCCWVSGGPVMPIPEGWPP